MIIIGENVEYKTSNGEIRKGIVVSIEYHTGLGKNIYNCISPFGNKFRLTEDELVNR